MNCPQCKKEMKYVGEELTYSDNRKEYHKDVYHCESEDIWVAVEIPTDKTKNLA